MFKTKFFVAVKYESSVQYFSFALHIIIKEYEYINVLESLQSRLLNGTSTLLCLDTFSDLLENEC